MKEIREFVEKYLWLAALVAGAMMIVHGFAERYSPSDQTTSPAAILGGALLVSVSLVCVTFGRRAER